MKLIKITAAAICVALLSFFAAAYIELHLFPHSYADIEENQLLLAEEKVQEHLVPVPGAFKWHFFKSSAGASLRTGLLEHPSPKATVIVVPGYTATIEMAMREVVMIHEAGYTVAAVEYRGQGLSHRPLAHEPQKGYVESYELLADELAQFGLSVRQEGTPLFFYSLSKGAHITLRMAAAKGLEVDGVALVVPMIQLSGGPSANGTMFHLSRLMLGLGLAEAYVPGARDWSAKDLVFNKPDPCNQNPETASVQAALFALNKNLRVRGPTYKWLYETTESIDKLSSPNLMKNLVLPIKIYTAGRDLVVSSESAQDFCDSLENCEYTHIESAGHCIDMEYREVYVELIRDAVNYFDSLVSL